MGWQDRKFQREEAGASYPYIQWVNDGTQLEPRQPRGGFALPEDQMTILEAYPKGAMVCKLHFKSGEGITVFYTAQLTVAVLATRFCWLKDGNRVPNYVEGARSKSQALCLFLNDGGEWTGPAMLTFRGLSGRHFWNALQKHRMRIRQVTKGQAPSYAFAMTVEAGELTMVGKGQQSRITPMQLVEGDFDPDAAYIGDDTLDCFDTPDFWKEVDAWVDAWKLPGTDGSDDGEEAERSGSAHTPPPPPEPPADSWEESAAPNKGAMLAQARNTKLPTTKKYGADATVGDLETAGDKQALTWFIEHAAKYPDVAAACNVVLNEIETIENDIPF